MSRGFTLVELSVASVVILVVLSALFFALVSFVRAGKTLELQDGALTLARVEMAELERLEEPPFPGRTQRPDTLWGHIYNIETSVALQGDSAVSVLVAVTSGDSVSIELSRRFYMQTSTNRRELL